MLIFANEHSRTQYNRLKQFYAERIRKLHGQIERITYANCFNGKKADRMKSYFSAVDLLEEVRYFEEFTHLEEYATNANADVCILATKGDFTGFDVLFQKPVYNEFGHEIEKKNWFNGGFINHGTIRKPQWSLHT